jgi:signal transduction histidine kinase
MLPRRLPRWLLPSRTIRLRLTVLYASLFLASGIGLLAVTYVLVRHATNAVLVGKAGDGGSFVIQTHTGTSPAGKPEGAATNQTFQGSSTGGGLSTRMRLLTKEQLQAQIARDRALAERQHTAELHQLAEQSGIALLLMAALSIGVGWIAAGRVLRPLRTINERARQISAHSLHRRLALAGPDDELTQLAQTIDDLLGRLETSFAAQRQFVANASHELRTPLTRARTVAEVALDDPAATVDSLRASHQRVLAAGDQQERLIEALLTLARSERGLDTRVPFDLAAITADVVDARRAEAATRGVAIHASLGQASAIGNPELAERLVGNLIDNAMRYNVPHGRIEVSTATGPEGQTILSVSNTGPHVPADEIDRLARPFQRLGADRTDRSDGVGLGLSIVAAVATAHDATVCTRARAEGGPSTRAVGPRSMMRPSCRTRLSSQSRSTIARLCEIST